MRYRSHEIVIEKEPEDRGYYAYSPTLPACFSNGRTVEETTRNMREAVELHLESLAARGVGPPPLTPPPRRG